MSSLHPDGTPVSYYNHAEDSLHHPAQQVLKIAPAEKNFQTLLADQATEQVASWSMTTPSASTMIGQDLKIDFVAMVRVEHTANGTSAYAPKFPPKFAPVSQPLAKATESCRVTINGLSDSCEPSLLAKAREYYSHGDDHMINSTQPRQKVRGSSVGLIPRYADDYYFGGEFRNAKSYDDVPDLRCESSMNATNAWVPWYSRTHLGAVDKPAYTELYYNFVCPVPFDLFMNKNTDALVNINELQIYLKFHQNLLSRMFAWQGDFTAQREYKVSCNINTITTEGDSIPGRNIMRLLYTTITSSSESKIPKQLTVNYNTYRITREQIANTLEPKEAVKTDFFEAEPERLSPNSTQVIMKSIRINQIPNTIEIMAMPTQAKLDMAKPCSNIQYLSIPYGWNPEDKEAGKFLPGALVNQVSDGYVAARSIFVFKSEFVANNGNPCLSLIPRLAKLLQDGKTWMEWRHNVNATWNQSNAIRNKHGGWDDLLDAMGWDGVTGASEKLRATTLGNWNNANQERTQVELLDAFAAIVKGKKFTDPVEFTPEQYNGLLVGRFRIARAMGTAKDDSFYADVDSFSQGYGNELPMLKISDIRVSLNNKHNILMTPGDDGDKFYYEMTVKNGLTLTYQEYLQGAPIRIDLGENIGARGLVVGSTGIFDCVLQYTVTNLVRENALPYSAMSLKHDVYQQHPIASLSGGFTAYAIFGFTTALTIQPEQAGMQTGVPLEEVTKAVNNIIPNEESPVVRAGGFTSWARRGIKAIHRIHGKAKEVHDLGKQVYNIGKDVHQAIKGNGVEGGASKMYG